MNRRVPTAFLSLVFLQAVHSAEEFVFGFYEKFPPMRIIYRDAPALAGPAFAISNVLLFLAGLVCFYYWVRPAARRARTVVRVWLILESFNVVAHLVWAVIVRGYNPGLATVILFVPVLVYLGHLTKRGSPRGDSGRDGLRPAA